MTTNRDPKGKFTKADPCPFKVGDRVRLAPEHWALKDGEEDRTYTIENIDSMGDLWTDSGRVYHAGICLRLQDRRSSTHGFTKVEYAPEGGFVDPGPSTPGSEPLEEHMPFKVGDRVTFPQRDGIGVGTVEKTDSTSFITVHSESGYRLDIHECDLRKVDDKAPIRPEITKLIESLRAEILRLQVQAQERANAYSQKVNVIKTELDAARHEQDISRGEALTLEALLDQEKARADASEAKLADIAAIRRTMQLLNAAPSETSLGNLIDAVVAGEVAA